MIQGPHWCTRFPEPSVWPEEEAILILLVLVHAKRPSSAEDEFSWFSHQHFLKQSSPTEIFVSLQEPGCMGSL